MRKRRDDSLSSQPPLQVVFPLPLHFRFVATYVSLCLALCLENLVVVSLKRSLFAGSWEVFAAWKVMLPFGFAGLTLAAIFFTLLYALPRLIFGLVGAVSCGFLSYFLSTGRHFETWIFRGSFIFVFLFLGLVLAWFAHPIIHAFSPSKKLGLGLVLACLTLFANAQIFPKHYPVFHSAMDFLFLSSVVLSSDWVISFFFFLKRRWTQFVICILQVILFFKLGHLARALEPWDNLKIILIEYAPIERQLVKFASYISGSSLSEQAKKTDNGQLKIDEKNSTPDSRRSLDWEGRDIILLTVDALRADHLGLYGYLRRTSPNLDVLAEKAVVFERAYCPTPHTSYSIVSLMTGKYMRPLMTMEMGENSETWANFLRRYDYRTAAFYPPAVFYIDREHFKRFEENQLGFEYAKVEFAKPELRLSQFVEYIEMAPSDHPLFLWTHIFEPHEPYEMHKEHVFGDPTSPLPIDVYDSEIAASDELIGKMVSKIKEKRPNAVIIVTADHGEEFGDHGGKYHGSSVFEEQVRVPLLILTHDLMPKKIDIPVQTIDLLPTLLSALNLPFIPSLRGQNLGELMSTPSPKIVEEKENGENLGGFAFSETDDDTMLAEGKFRLLCKKQEGACALYDLVTDEGQKKDVSSTYINLKTQMKEKVKTFSLLHGRYESIRNKEPMWPAALRRAMSGERESAIDVTSLLEDADVNVRRMASKMLFKLAFLDSLSAIEYIYPKEDDKEARHWLGLALLRISKKRNAAIEDEIMAETDIFWRRRMGLVYAELGSPVLEQELSEWLADSDHDFAETKEILAALGKIRSKNGVGPMTRLLDDIRLRPFVLDALKMIGLPHANSSKKRLFEIFREERHVPLRHKELETLYMLGGSNEIWEVARRFAGVPEANMALFQLSVFAKKADKSFKRLYSIDEVKGSSKKVGRLYLRTKPIKKLFSLDVLGKNVTAEAYGMPSAPSPSSPFFPSSRLEPSSLLQTESSWFVVPLDMALPPNTKSILLTFPKDVEVLDQWLVPYVNELGPPLPEKWMKLSNIENE